MNLKIRSWFMPTLSLCIGMVDSFRSVSLYNLQNTPYGGTKFLDEGKGFLDLVYLKNTM